MWTRDRPADPARPAEVSRPRLTAPRGRTMTGPARSRPAASAAVISHRHSSRWMALFRKRPGADWIPSASPPPASDVDGGAALRVRCDARRHRPRRVSRFPRLPRAGPLTYFVGVTANRVRQRLIGPEKPTAAALDGRDSACRRVTRPTWRHASVTVT